METFSASLAICAGNSQVTDKGQWRGALMFPLICAWINVWTNNHEAGDLRRHWAHYDVTVMKRDCITSDVIPKSLSYSKKSRGQSMDPWGTPHTTGVTHYSDVIMGAMASQITSLAIVYSAVYSGAYQRKHQNSASLAFVRGIHRWPVNSPHKGSVTRKMFPVDDVIMHTRVTVVNWHGFDL